MKLTLSNATRKPLLAAAVGLAALGLPLTLGGAAVSARQLAAPQQGTAEVEHWGSFTIRQEDRVLRPASIGLPGPVAEVATSNSTQYALLTNGTVYAWGMGTDGQLGNGGTADSFSRAVQVRFPVGVRIASIPTDAMPFNTGLAIDTTGHVWGWGLNLDGELCLGNHREYNTPVELPFAGVTQTAGGGEHALYEVRGNLYACGSGRSGDLGDGSTQDSKLPVQVRLRPGTPVTALVASWGDSGALLENGTYDDWGYNHQGQLGDGRTNTPSDVPVQVPLPGPVTRVVQGGSLSDNGQTLVMLSDGSLYAWGDDADHQLGDGGTGIDPAPVGFHPPHGVQYTALATSGTTSYALSSTGDVWAWGDGSAGQLGDGGTGVARKPELVASGASAISATANDVAVQVRSGG